MAERARAAGRGGTRGARLSPLVAPAAALLLGACAAAVRPPSPSSPPSPSPSPSSFPPAGDAEAGSDAAPLGDVSTLASDGRPEPDAPLDTDADGIVDAGDACPGTPADEIVDARGCARFSGVLAGVTFPPGNDQLGTEARAALARLVTDLEAYPEVVIRIDGHTDNRGSAADNLALSKRRVLSVARFLVVDGVAPERLRPYGYGESRPVASNATPAGRERNRRIEIGAVRAPDTLALPADARQNAPMSENPS